MDTGLLTVYASPFPKERLGRERDGGYVTVVLPVGYDLLLSAGVSDDLSFEEAWLDRYGGNCVAYDGTISRCPSSREDISWVCRNVGGGGDDLSDVLSSHSSVFLKMDIEGHETGWFRNLDPLLLGRISQMVVEFHHRPYDDLHAGVYEKLNSTHALLHLHGNNFGGETNHGGVVMPVTFEGTWVSRKFLGSLSPNVDPLPGEHDRPNMGPGSRDVDLNHPPFRFPAS